MRKYSQLSLLKPLLTLSSMCDLVLASFSLRAFVPVFWAVVFRVLNWARCLATLGQHLAVIIGEGRISV